MGAKGRCPLYLPATLLASFHVATAPTILFDMLPHLESAEARR
jgi:hypothetical protein